LRCSLAVGSQLAPASWGKANVCLADRQAGCNHPYAGGTTATPRSGYRRRTEPATPHVRSAMPAERVLPTPEATELIGLIPDVTAMTTRADRQGEEYVLTGTKSWITHGGHADFYSVFARTSEHRTRGISTFLLRAGAPGLSFGTPERKMGLTGSPTTTLHLD